VRIVLIGYVSNFDIAIDVHRVPRRRIQFQHRVDQRVSMLAVPDWIRIVSDVGFIVRCVSTGRVRVVDGYDIVLVVQHQYLQRHVGGVTMSLVHCRHVPTVDQHVRMQRLHDRLVSIGTGDFAVSLVRDRHF
jgi:hypothetical protein